MRTPNLEASVLAFVTLSGSARSPEVFRREALEVIRAFLGFDCAAFLSPTRGLTLSSADPSFAFRSTTVLRMRAPDIASEASTGVSVVDLDAHPAQNEERIADHAPAAELHGQVHQVLAYASLHDRLTCVVQLCRHGASAFRPEELERLQRLLTGLAVAQSANESTLPIHRGWGEPAAHCVELPRLTPRERQIAALVARGLQNKEIAEELKTSVFTVRNQLQRIMERTGISNRTALAGAVIGSRLAQER